MIDGEMRARLAKTLGVDEVLTFGTARDSVGFVVRIGDLQERAEIDLIPNPRSAVDVMTKALFQLATAVKYRAACEDRRRALQELQEMIGSVRRVEPVSMEPPYTRLVDQGQEIEQATKLADRFAAVAEEMENT